MKLLILIPFFLTTFCAGADTSQFSPPSYLKSWAQLDCHSVILESLNPLPKKLSTWPIKKRNSQLVRRLEVIRSFLFVYGELSSSTKHNLFRLKVVNVEDFKKIYETLSKSPHEAVRLRIEDMRSRLVRAYDQGVATLGPFPKVTGPRHFATVSDARFIEKWASEVRELIKSGAYDDRPDSFYSTFLDSDISFDYYSPSTETLPFDIDVYMWQRLELGADPELLRWTYMETVAKPLGHHWWLRLPN